MVRVRALPYEGNADIQNGIAAIEREGSFPDFTFREEQLCNRKCTRVCLLCARRIMPSLLEGRSVFKCSYCDFFYLSETRSPIRVTQPTSHAFPWSRGGGKGICTYVPPSLSLKLLFPFYRRNGNETNRRPCLQTTHTPKPFDAFLKTNRSTRGHQMLLEGSSLDLGPWHCLEKKRVPTRLPIYF